MSRTVCRCRQRGQSAPARDEGRPTTARSVGGHAYGASVSATRPPPDYTARVIPYFDGVVIPLEDARILWQR